MDRLHCFYSTDTFAALRKRDCPLLLCIDQRKVEQLHLKEGLNKTS